MIIGNEMVWQCAIEIVAGKLRVVELYLIWQTRLQIDLKNMDQAVYK